MIDWSDPSCQVSQHFTVKEALWLPHWGRLANETDGLNDDIKQELTSLCQKLDQVRDFLGQPMNVHCMYRPCAYNLAIKAPEHDVHSMGMAVDFDCNPHLSCDDVKSLLEPKLEEMNIRMENNGVGAQWVHIDIHAVMHARYFNP